MGELSWEFHPFREKAIRSWIVVILLLGICLTMNWAFEGWLWSVLAALFLFGSLSRWLLPTRYRLDEKGVELRFLGTVRHRPWSDFNAVHTHPRGLHLSPELFLRCAPGMGTEVEAYCRARMTAAAETARAIHVGGER